MSFSERKGLRPIRQLLQTESMDAELKSRLWNVLRNSLPTFREGYSFSLSENYYLRELCQSIWHDYFKRPTDTIPNFPDQAIKQIRSYFFDASGTKSMTSLSSSWKYTRPPRRG